MKYMASLVMVETPDTSVLSEGAERFGELSERGVIPAAYLAHDRRRG